MSGLKLRIKNAPSVDKANITLSEKEPTLKIVSDGGPEKLTPKRTKKKSNRYFYKVSNHHELFKIGRSFYSDYMAGVKSFAITSTGYQTSQQKTILGLASFFDHKEDLKIGIISDNLKQGAFKDIVSISKTIQHDLFGQDRSVDIKSFYNHFEFLDLNQLLDMSNDNELGEYENVFDQVVDLYDIVFWDVPELHNVQVDSERYFPVIMKFESISIIVAQSLTKKGDVEDIKKFFLGYGINLKGLLLEEKTSLNKTDSNPINSKPQESKPWWKKIFKE